MKRLKPGQLATINGHVYRCSKPKEYWWTVCNTCPIFDACHSGHNIFAPFDCEHVFGRYCNPILVK